MQEQLRQAQEERDCHLKTISSLKQEVKDTVDGQRILEKKGSAALKDLKRQLHLERKRADKLQERLQDILTNSKSRSGEGPRAQGRLRCGEAEPGPEGWGCFLYFIL